MDKRLIAITVLITVIWIDALVNNYVLVSDRETLASKISEVKDALMFQRYIELIEDCHPYLPRRGISNVAVKTYERLRDEILLKTKEEADRIWNEDVANAERMYQEDIESLRESLY